MNLPKEHIFYARLFISDKNNVKNIIQMTNALTTQQLEFLFFYIAQVFFKTEFLPFTSSAITSRKNNLWSAHIALWDMVGQEESFEPIPQIEEKEGRICQPHWRSLLIWTASGMALSSRRPTDWAFRGRSP